jgi:hypothetical protein
MSPKGYFTSFSDRIVVLHELLDSIGIRHQFGGGIALAWYRNPRATTDIDVNVTIPPSAADPVLGSVGVLGVSVSAANRAAVKKVGQARLDWQGAYLDVFFATTELHQEMAREARLVQFGPVQIPILSPEHLIVCKAIFNLPKHWLDIEEMVEWGTEIDAGETLHWLDEILGHDSAQAARLAAILEAAPS